VTSDGSNTLNDDELAAAVAEPVVAHANLGSHSARGLAYLFAGASATKAIVYVSQLLVLYLVDPEVLGVVVLAQTITAFILLIAQAGVIDVLIHRRAFKQWAIPSFWLALALGLLSCLLVGISAPIAARIFTRDPVFQKQLFWLLILSVPVPLTYALAVVPRAQLSRQLRFRALSVVNVAETLLLNSFTLLFAWLGFGPYSFVLPFTIAGLILTVALWWWVLPPWAPKLGLRRWRYLFGDSNRLLQSEFGRMLIDQSDYMSLGLFQVDPSLIGIYANGFRFSLQTIRLLMVNLTTILFPAFTKLNDQPQRQYDAFFKAERILAVVGVSGCLLQAAAADSFAHLCFPQKYHPSIIVMQILSLGMATRMIAGGATALLKAQGRFVAVRNIFWTYAVVQVALLVTVLSMGGNIIAVSIVVSIVSAAMGPITVYIAIQSYGSGWAGVADVLVRPLVCGILSVGAAWLIAQRLGSSGQNRLLYLFQLAEICVVSVVLNCLLARLWMRPVWDDLWIRIGRLLPRRAAA
jgi:O-antigen/teichoic acid export membrane protein